MPVMLPEDEKLGNSESLDASGCRTDKYFTRFMVFKIVLGE